MHDIYRSICEFFDFHHPLSYDNNDSRMMQNICVETKTVQITREQYVDIGKRTDLNLLLNTHVENERLSIP